MSNQEYHDAPGISNSGLSLIAKCPAEYKARYIDGIVKDPTPDMVIGSAVHKAVLEPETFDEEFVFAPDINRRTKAGREEWARFEEENSGKTIVDRKHADTIKGMADAVKTHPVAGRLFDGGEAELSVFHLDDDLLVKVRPDYLVEDLLIDLKTAVDASPEAFARSLYNYRYYVQAAMYMDVVKRVQGRFLSSFIFVVVEKKEPYHVAVYKVDSEAMMAGMSEYRRCLAIYRHCRQEDKWPGYGGGRIMEISLPRWAR